MQLFRVEGEYVTPHPEIRNISPFNEIIRRDRGSKGDSQGRRKLMAVKELSYIYHMEDPLSPYATWAEEHREQAIIEALFTEDDWSADELVRQGQQRYRQLTESQASRLLRAARKSINKMEEYFENFNPEASDDSGKSVKDLIANISKLEALIEGLDRLEERIKKQKQGEKQIKAGIKATKYNTE